jgi:flagellar basal body-associated protein FliL
LRAIQRARRLKRRLRAADTSPQDDKEDPRMTRSRYIIVLVVLALVGGGAALMLTGGLSSLTGKSQPPAKAVLDPVTFTEPFLVNLTDTDSPHYVKLQVSVQLEPMTEADKAMFLKGKGGEGANVQTGVTMLQADPVLRDAVITTVARFNSTTLLSDAGKSKLKKALLADFERVAADEEAARGGGKKGAEHDPIEPPYHISNVFFPEFAVQ